MKKENILEQKYNFLDKENNINIGNFNESFQFSANKTNKSYNHNNNYFIQQNISKNSFNDIETNEHAYSFKPKNQETPNFLIKEEKYNVSDFLSIKNIDNDNFKEKDEELTIFTEILKTKIEFNENIEKKQNNYLKEIDEKKRLKDMKNEIEKRCKNLRESIDMNRKKILKNMNKIKLEKK